MSEYYRGKTDGIQEERDRINEWMDVILQLAKKQYTADALANSKDVRAMEALRCGGVGLVHTSGSWHYGDNSAFEVCDGWDDDDLFADPADAIIAFTTGDEP